MKSIIFVTSNQGKINSAKSALKDIEVLPYNAELIEPRSDDIKEIAKAKVEQAFKMTKKPCIAMDSGFFIDAWNGFPRAYVNPVLETLGIKGILKLMEGIENRSCKFRTSLAYYDGHQMSFFESEAPGNFSTEILGSDNDKKWSDLWYIFKPRNFTKTLAEFNEDDFKIYNELSTPSAIVKFGEWYNNL